MERRYPLAKNKVNQEIEKEPTSEAEAETENDENADDENNKSEAPADQS